MCPSINKCFIAAVLLFFSALCILSCSKAGFIPLKTRDKINIPDGEFLHYESYKGNEKDSDFYYITRKTNQLYRIYMKNISVNSRKIITGEYTNWPSLFIIDPVKGSVIEMSMTMDTNTSIYKNNETGMAYPYYWDYKLSSDKSRVDFNMKSILNRKLTISRYRVRVNPAFPVWENISLSSFAPRFLDYHNSGILYSVAPFVLKDPLPFSFKHIKSEEIETKAGSFKTDEIETAMADPFLERMMSRFTEGSGMWVDSSSGLLIKNRFLGSETVLENISNIFSN